MEKIDFYTRVVIKKLGVPAEWRWCSIETVGVDTLVKGGVPRLLKRGKRKGKPTWKDSTLQTCVVTSSELCSEREAFELQSGNCWECQGSKETVWSWSATEGSKYRACGRCKGTGIRPANP